MTQAQEKLKAEHGTPWEFRKACVIAWKNLWITDDEFTEAVKKYEAEWRAAGSQSDAADVKAADESPLSRS